MKILERYILLENIKPFLISVAVITMVMLLDRFLDIMSIIMGKNLGFFTIMRIFSLSLPFILALSVPMSVLMASIISFGRLSVDRELLAFKSCGINIYRLIKPTVIAAAFISIFMMYFNDRILPETNHALKNLRTQIMVSKPSTGIAVRNFTDLQDLSVYVDNKEGDELQGVLIFAYAQKKTPRTITATRGYISLVDGGNAVQAELFDGQIYEPDKAEPDKFTLQNFKRLEINLTDMGNKIMIGEDDSRSDREMPVAMMRQDIEKYEQERQKELKELNKLKLEQQEIAQISNHKERQRKLTNVDAKIELKNSRVDIIQAKQRELLVEIHKKYALSVACLVFVLVGVPVGMMTRSSGIGMAFSFSSGVYLIYYISLVVGEQMGDKGVIPPWLGMWFSNIILAIVGGWLVYLSMQEDRHIDWSRVKAFLLRLLAKVTPYKIKPPSEYEKSLKENR